jgi:hypothetical protein
MEIVGNKAAAALAVLISRFYVENVSESFFTFPEKLKKKE